MADNNLDMLRGAVSDIFSGGPGDVSGGSYEPVDFTDLRNTIMQLTGDLVNYSIPYEGPVRPKGSNIGPGKDRIRRYDDRHATERTKEFISKIYPIMEEELDGYKHSDNAIDWVMQQLALESNYGQSDIGGSYNLAGIQAVPGNAGPGRGEVYVTRDKKVYGSIDDIPDGNEFRRFRTYDGYRDFVKNYLSLLNNRYNALTAGSHEQFIDRLHGRSASRAGIKDPGMQDKYDYSESYGIYRDSIGRYKTLQRLMNTFKANGNMFATGGDIGGDNDYTLGLSLKDAADVNDMVVEDDFIEPEVTPTNVDIDVALANISDSIGDISGDEGEVNQDVYYGQEAPLKESVIKATLPSLRSKQGKRIAKNMAANVASGKMKIQNVPARYRSYVEGEVKGAMPMTKFMNEEAWKVPVGALAVPTAVIGGAELGAAIPTIAAEAKATAPLWGKAALRMLRDIPAFEVIDRIPTLWGDKRFTEAGGDASQWLMEHSIAPNKSKNPVVTQLSRFPGEIVSGFLPGATGDIVMNAGSKLAGSIIDNSINKFNTKYLRELNDISDSFSSFTDEFRTRGTTMSDAEVDAMRFGDIENKIRKFGEKNNYNFEYPESDLNYYDFDNYARFERNPVMQAILKDMDDIALHGGFKYNNIVPNDGIYDHPNFSSYRMFNAREREPFFINARKHGVDVDRLLNQYKDFADYATGTNEYLPFEYSNPGLMLDKIRNGSLKVHDYKVPIIDEVVNQDGSINQKNLVGAYRNILRNIYSSGIEPFGLNKKYQSGINTTTLKDHISGVVKTAQEIPVPEGSTRKELVTAALAHDLGKLVTGQEAASSFAKHPEISMQLLESTPGIKHLSTPQVRAAVRLHMDSGELNPIFGAHGIGTSAKIGRHSTYNGEINWDLLHALQAADVARGLSYDDAASRFPQLFTYNRKLPKVDLYHGSDAEQLKYVINPLLKRYGYPTIKSGENPEVALQERLNTHRSFMRGVRDPKHATGVNRDQHERNLKNANILAERDYGISIPETRMLASLRTTALEPTGYGRASLWDHSLRQEPMAKYLKINPNEQDALYISLSPELTRTYASRGDDVIGIGAKVKIPLEPIKPGESLVDFIERGEFQLYNGNAIEQSKRPMSDFQLYEEPYRLQTGRSLLDDMKKEFKRLHPGVKINHPKTKIVAVNESFGGSGYNGIDPDIKYLADFSRTYGDILQRAKIKFNPYSNINGYTFVNYDALNYLRKSMQAVSTGDINYLSKNNLISDKQNNLAKRVLRQKGLSDFNQIYQKYIESSAVRKIKKNYYELFFKKQNRLNQEYMDFMTNKIGFMRDRGIAPLYEMPSFGNYQIFSTNGSGFGSRPKTISFNPGGSVPQGVIVGKRGDTLLDIERILHPDDIITLSGENYKKMASGKRDAGTRSVGDELLPFTRKTFASGGKIHIKPENRGKFTALKKRTGKSASWFKAHGTPAQRKMATFALNSKKWRHGEGGYLNY